VADQLKILSSPMCNLAIQATETNKCDFVILPNLVVLSQTVGALLRISA